MNIHAVSRLEVQKMRVLMLWGIKRSLDTIRMKFLPLYMTAQVGNLRDLPLMHDSCVQSRNPDVMAGFNMTISMFLTASPKSLLNGSAV